MAWYKTDVSDFFGRNVFPSKGPEFLHVLVNLPVVVIYIFLAALQRVSEKNKDKILERVHCGKKFHLKKKNLCQSCTKPFNYVVFLR